MGKWLNSQGLFLDKVDSVSRYFFIDIYVFLVALSIGICSFMIGA